MKLFTIFIFLCTVFFVGCTSLSKNTIISETNDTKTTCPDNLKIVGISTRTTNQNGQSLIDIESLWKRFWAASISAQVPGKMSEDIYAVYTEYDKGSSGNYTALIGFQVSSFSNISSALTKKNIAVGRCKKIVSKGKMPDAIAKTWMEIWQDKNLNRAYRADFTIHGKKYYEGENAEVETYISIN